MSIPSFVLKQVIQTLKKPLCNIWNNQILQNKDFPKELKLADIKPVHKKLFSNLNTFAYFLSTKFHSIQSLNFAQN